MGYGQLTVTFVAPVESTSPKLFVTCKSILTLLAPETIPATAEKSTAAGLATVVPLGLDVPAGNVQDQLVIEVVLPGGKVEESVKSEVQSPGPGVFDVKLVVGAAVTVTAWVSESVSPKLFVTCRVTSNAGDVPGVPVMPPKSTVMLVLVNVPALNTAPAGSVH